MGLELHIAEPQLVARHVHWPYLVLLRDGSRIVSSIRRAGPLVTDTCDAKTMVVDSVVSRDRGHTWAPCIPASSTTVELRDGTVMSLGYRTTQGYLNPQDRYQGKVNPPGEFETYVRYSTDGWRTISYPFIARVHVPEATGGYDDMGFPSYGPVFYRSILELDDGRLLASMYGALRGYTAPIPGTLPDMHQTKCCSWVVESNDRGKSWSYVSTIGCDADIGIEGFDEPIMERLANGDILCVMRTGVSMYQSRSVDEGRTWSAPVTLGVKGVSPDLCLMRNGVLACSYGRPGNHLMFSEDGTGRRWTQRTQIHPGTGSTGYTCIEETAAGKLLYVYDCDPRVESGDRAGTGPDPEQRVSVFRTVEISVERLSSQTQRSSRC